MFKACEVGIAFNCMSSYVDYKDKQFSIASRIYLTFVKDELNGHPTLVHNYVLKKKGFHDYTVTVLKEPELPIVAF